jgi:hypothetical protein
MDDEYKPEVVPVVAHAEGQQAARYGESRLENPYRPGTTCHESWDKGYDNEMDKYRKASAKKRGRA